VNTCLILEIFAAICWQSDEGVEQIMSAFAEMQAKKRWKYAIEPLQRGL
jgi:hypothetical protein